MSDRQFPGRDRVPQRLRSDHARRGWPVLPWDEQLFWLGSYPSAYRLCAGRLQLWARAAKEPEPTLSRPFLWPAGTSLDDALADAGLTLADKPLPAIELMPLVPAGEVASCPVHEGDRHLLVAH